MSNSNISTSNGTASVTVTELSESRTNDFWEIRESNGRILENLDDGAGRVWRVTMIKPGTSKNGRRYRKEVLAEAASLYEGARSFDGHRTMEETNASRVRDLVGWHENINVADDGSLQSDFHISENAEHVRRLFLTAYKNDRPDLIGFSHDVRGSSRPVQEAGQRIVDVERIAEVKSVDVVAEPAAGGRLERLVASRQEEGTDMADTPFDAASFVGDLDEETKKELRALLDPTSAEVETEEATEESTPEPAATAVTDNSQEGDDPVMDNDKELVGAATESRLAAGSLLQRTALREALEGKHLPDGAVVKITEAVTSKPRTENEIVDMVAEYASIYETVAAATPANLPGQGAQVVQEDIDRKQKALDGLIAGDVIDGVTPYMSLKEAYADYTGRSPFSKDSADFNRRILAESVGGVAHADDRLSESVTSSSWSNALGDSITRRAIAEYSLPALQSWRQVTSSVVPVSDFRTQRRDRIGGFDVLQTVGEGVTYPALTSQTDEEATYSVTKKGGTEDLTMETIANDDIGAVRRIPMNLGRAAALTLYRAVWNTTIAGNAAIYDGDTLFHANHSNTTAVALGESGISTLRNLMVTQARLGESSGFIGLTPRYLVVPPELYTTAYKLAESAAAVVGAGEAATTPNPWQGLQVIEVPTLTDADDWFLVADPRTVPTLEVGFYQGRQDPEILIQDQPAVGSVFTADKVTYKVRHVWGLSVLDYRGFQRGTQ